MIKVTISFLVLLTVMTTAGPRRNMVTVIHPKTDGYLSPRESSRNHPELWVQGSGGVISWTGFNLHGYTFSRTRTCMLCLNVTSVARRGICDIHQIVSPLSTAGKSITRKSIRFDDIPLVSVPLDSSFSGQMLFVNITELARAGEFHGIVIQSRGALDAAFSATEGALPPAIICTHDLGDSSAVSWFSGRDRPDPQTGKPGDFMVRTGNGSVYYKKTADWDSVGTLVKPVLKKRAFPCRAGFLLPRKNEDPVDLCRQQSRQDGFSPKSTKPEIHLYPARSKRIFSHAYEHSINP